MYRIGCKSREIEAACRKPSCVYPGICPNLNTDHAPLIRLYRKARALRGVKKILIASGLRYDLAVKSPEYIKELATHHVGGYLKIAPEHTEGGPLSKMMKPGIGSYDRFKQLFDKFSAEAGKQQYLIPYFIAAHPGTSDEDMMNLALWLKKNGFRADQVQTFYPSPMATATAMYHSGRNPLKGISRDPQRGEKVDIVRGERRRRLHKAFLRYHDAAQLAAAARGFDGDGPRRPDRQWQAAPDPQLPASVGRGLQQCAAQEFHAGGGQARRTDGRSAADPAHRAATARARCGRAPQDRGHGAAAQAALAQTRRRGMPRR